MRFNKTIFVLFLAASLSPVAVFGPVEAKQTHGTEAPSQSETKNDGRKLSMTFPGIGTAVVTVTPVRAKPLIFGKPFAPGRQVTLGNPGETNKDLSVETNGNNITVRVPASIDAAIDDAQVVSRQLSKNAGNGLLAAKHVVDLVVLYFKQWTGSTTVTPGGYPYVEKSSNLPTFAQASTTIASGHKLYFTGEGRLKSVVNR